jgi:hypothetical protein
MAAVQPEPWLRALITTNKIQLYVYTRGVVKQYKRKIIWLNFWNGVPPTAKQRNCLSLDSCIQNSSIAGEDNHSGPEENSLLLWHKKVKTTQQ